MNIKSLNRWLFAFSFGLALFFAGFSNIFAQDFSSREVVLERFDHFLYSPIVQEESSFNAVMVKADRELEGLMVNFNSLNGGEWRAVEIHDDGFGADSLLFTDFSNSNTFFVNFYF